jgi:uncharacterized protein
MHPLTRRSNAAEIEAFQTVCERLAGFDPLLGWETVDGWLAALAAAPELPEPEAWLPALAGDAFDRAFADPPDRAQALRALKARLSVLRQQLDPDALLDDPDALALEPLMAAWDGADADADSDGQPEPDPPLTGAEWAQAFGRGLAWTAPRQAAPLPGPDDDADEQSTLRELLAAVAALALAPGTPAWQAHVARAHGGTEPDRDGLIDMAVLAVQDLRVWWMERLPRPATRRVEATPGRNDPCPCGSGRKFKKCHGAG